MPYADGALDVNFLADLFSGNYFRELKNRKLAQQMQRMQTEYGMAQSPEGVANVNLPFHQQAQQTRQRIGAEAEGFKQMGGIDSTAYTALGQRKVSEAEATAIPARTLQGQEQLGLSREQNNYLQNIGWAGHHAQGSQFDQTMGLQQDAMAQRSQGDILNALASMSMYNPSIAESMSQSLYPMFFGGPPPKPPEDPVAAQVREALARKGQPSAATPAPMQSPVTSSTYLKPAAPSWRDTSSGPNIDPSQLNPTTPWSVTNASRPQSVPEILQQRSANMIRPPQLDAVPHPQVDQQQLQELMAMLLGLRQAR